MTNFPALLGLAAALLATFALTSCSLFEPACPAVGWMNKLTVTLDGDTSGVDEVKVCVDDDCAPMDDPGADELGVFGQTTREGSGAEWTFIVDMYAPEAFDVRVYDDTGAVIATEPVQPDWERVGGSAQCGGPGIASVTVPI